MREVTCKGGLSLPQVVAGCMRAKDSNLTGKEFLDFVEGCLELGVTAFDHAPVYGGYACEQMFGDAVLKRRPDLRGRMQLVTKAGIVLPGRDGNRTIYYQSTKGEIRKEMDDSLRKLGTDHVDLLLIHRPDVLADPAETADALETVVREGKALHVGVSNFTPSQLEMLQSYLAIPLEVNQIELSVKAVDHFFDGSVDDALTRRMPLMAWSPLGGGSVFSGTDDQSVRLREVLMEVAQDRGTSMDTVMYAWLFAHPARIIAVTGTMNLGRMKAARDALGLDLSYDEWYRILEASRGYRVP